MSEKQRVLRAIDAVMKWNPIIRLEARLDGESWYVKGTCVSCGRHADVFAVTVETAKNTVGAYAFMTDIARAVSGLLSQCSRRECETNKQTDAAHAIRGATYKLIDAIEEDRVYRFFDSLKEPIDPMDRLVDGLTVRECLAAYERLQREDHTTHARYVPVSLGGVHLTPNQRDAARLAWSAELKRKQQEAEAKERASVCVDDDRWEP